MKIINNLNNIFDQYDVEENRVTNAFLQTLSNSEDLLKKFLVYFEVSVRGNSEIIISSQKRPFSIGDELGAKEIDSIPDGWIIIDETIAIVFEAKVGSNAIKKTQLCSHLRKIKGYEQKFLCVITPDEQSPVDFILDGVPVKWFSWRAIYELIISCYDNNDKIGNYLITKLKEFLLMKEDLVGFQGVNYTDDVYNSHEAKNILKSLMKEIKPDMQKSYPLLSNTRKLVTADADSVWSSLGVEGDFTQDIHITMWFHRTHLGVGMTIPNNASKRWKRLRNIFRDDALFEEFTGKIFALREKTPHLYFEFVQRHYFQRRKEISDGTLEVDVDTIKVFNKTKVKLNPVWLQVLRDIVRNNDNYDYNGQLMIRTKFFYNDHSEIKKASFKDEIIKTINHFSDIYQFLSVKS